MILSNPFYDSPLLIYGRLHLVQIEVFAEFEVPYIENESDNDESILFICRHLSMLQSSKKIEDISINGGEDTLSIWPFPLL